MKRYGPPLLLVEVALRLLLVDIGLRLLPLRRLLALTSSPRARRRARLAEVDRITRGFERRIFRGSNCLRTSLVLFWMGGPRARLHVGVPGEKKEFEAHAWVECDGKTFSLAPAASYVTLTTFGKPA